MITPAFGLTATERVLPKLALDFTTASLDSRVTFTRSGDTATVTNSSGVIVGINANLPRFDYDPTTLVCKGLLIEEARTNALLNSLIDGTSLTTQIVTVTAAARTLSFYGTGEIVLSGAHSATVTGTGAYPSRKTLTFTPSAGALTLTVTGTVQFAQLEIGAFATSFIPTTTTALTRNADVATMTGTNFSDWYNATEGTFSLSGIPMTTASSGALSADDGTNNQRMQMRELSGGGQAFIVNGGVTQANLATGTWAANALGGCAFAYKADSFVCAAGGATPATDTVGTVPTVSRLVIGGSAGVNQTTFNGRIAKLNYWPQRLTNSETQAFSKV
jgi:hypothetical protein